MSALALILKWGGLALALLCVAALIYFEVVAPTPEPGTTAEEAGAPITLYYILFIIGAVAAVVGFVLARRKGGTQS